VITKTHSYSQIFNNKQNNNMKKTILTVLFSTACIAVGVEPVNLEWDDNQASLNNGQFNSNAISIVFTLDFTKLTTNGGDIFKLYGHNGSYNTWDGMSHQYESAYSPWEDDENKLVGIRNGSVNTGSLEYNLLSKPSATSADFVYRYSYGEAGGNLDITMYVYDNTGKQIDTKNFPSNTTKGYLTNFTLLELTSPAINNAEVYNKTLQGGEIELAIRHLKGGDAPDSPTVPEPTTATLSLLALAGLAARRRRR